MEKIITISPTANVLSMIRTDKSDKQILGELFVLNTMGQVLWQCYTLELPWVGNQFKISSIPPNRYLVTRRSSQKYKNHLHILDVPNRDLILIHNANYVHQLEGCIAVGRKRLDLNGDGLLDVTDSVNTLKELLTYIIEDTLIIIQ